MFLTCYMIHFPSFLEEGKRVSLYVLSEDKHLILFFPEFGIKAMKDENPDLFLPSYLKLVT